MPMTTNSPGINNDAMRDPEDFSFVMGGPLFQLFRRLHLTGDALELAVRRVVVLTAFAWLPLLALSVLQGRAVGERVAVPFLLDIETHVRFLVVVPLLVAAELIVHRRVRSVVGQFLQRDLIPPPARARFDAAIGSTLRLSGSMVAEVAILALVYSAGILIVWNRTALDASTWYATPVDGGKTLSLAGVWLVAVSLPFFQFLLLRWYYRMFVWVWFLWHVAGLDLRVVPTHPDRLGGLGFLSLIPSAFAPLAVAHGALVAGWIANRIFFHGGALPDFMAEIIGVTILMLCVVFGPLLVFTGKLFDAWEEGELHYGPLAARYAHEFEVKWLNPGPAPREPLLGTRDIQSLADMGRVYATVQTMRFAPITRVALAQLLVATLGPIAPLVLTMMPLGELVRRLLGAVAG
jgi:hypothetical protein